jgi:gluconate 5-dehydrogenase
MFDISGKVALVTGGGRGIGKVMAEVYGEAGAKVVICGRRAEWLNPTLEEFRAKGIDCISVIADLTDLEDVHRLVEASVQKYGQIDILVNNAGQTWGATTEDYPLEKWRLSARKVDASDGCQHQQHFHSLPTGRSPHD